MRYYDREIFLGGLCLLSFVLPMTGATLSPLTPTEKALLSPEKEASNAKGAGLAAPAELPDPLKRLEKVLAENQGFLEEIGLEASVLPPPAPDPAPAPGARTAALPTVEIQTIRNPIIDKMLSMDSPRRSAAKKPPVAKRLAVKTRRATVRFLTPLLGIDSLLTKLVSWVLYAVIIVSWLAFFTGRDRVAKGLAVIGRRYSHPWLAFLCVAAMAAYLGSGVNLWLFLPSSVWLLPFLAMGGGLLLVHLIGNGYSFADRAPLAFLNRPGSLFAKAKEKFWALIDKSYG